MDHEIFSVKIIKTSHGIKSEVKGNVERGSLSQLAIATTLSDILNKVLNDMMNQYTDGKSVVDNTTETEIASFNPEDLK